MFKNYEMSRRDLSLILTTVFFVVLIRTAWIGDDAGFTFRSILNFLSGYGPQFNIDERVQSFTHPLWFLLLSLVTLVTKNPFSSAFICSISISLLTLWMLLSYKRASLHGVILAGAGLLLSKAFTDYSTSGLENPLTNLLLLFAVFSAERCKDSSERNDQIKFFLAISCIYLSRPDAIILVTPLLLGVVYTLFRSYKKLLSTIFIGVLPVIIWTLFSLIYYGAFIPNTAYAKLNTGIPSAQLILQGFLYFVDSIGSDPITVPLIVMGIVIGILERNNNRLIAYGIILYLIYVVAIGGDFMSGRFFSTPALLAAYLISVRDYPRPKFFMILVGLIILGLPNFKSILLSDANFVAPNISAAGIADERGFYYSTYGLLNLKRDSFSPLFWEKSLKSNGIVKVGCDNSLHSFLFDGPDTHYIIDCALADPLLSRLPAIQNNGWRVGHYYRALPKGYKESVATNLNQIKDPALFNFYNVIKEIVAGDLFKYDRFLTIIRLNFTSQYDPYKLFLKRGFSLSYDETPYFINKVLGFSNREEWGRWSDQTQAPFISIQFLQPLPKKFTMSIEAKGFNVNINQPTKIRIGGEERTFTPEGDLKIFKIPFELSKNVSTIEIIPPNPIAPKEVDSHNSDSRRLGIGIRSIAFEM